MSKQVYAAILLFYCLVRMVSALYTPRGVVVGPAPNPNHSQEANDAYHQHRHHPPKHHHYRRHDVTTLNDNDTAIFGTWYLTGASANMQNMMVNSNLSAVQGMSCGCAYMYLSSDQETMNQDATSTDDDQCDDVIDIKTYCDLTMSGNPNATGQIATVGSAIPENNDTNASSTAITLEYTIDTLILSLGNWPQAPDMNQTIPVNYTMQVHSKLLNVSSFCNDDASCDQSNDDGGLVSWTDIDSQRYTALYTREASVNQTQFNDLVKQAGDHGKDLVQLHTTCASNSTSM
ncbi:hypothetical protein K492DRAFT_198946 [Lichtheimia hyalospora FSU 10163]|nr:hypothetical protein K492DRAFT_198946 [Lichtheimia hyalospora FSU 10163]